MGDKLDGVNDYKVRRLTALESWRLMDFDDDDFYAAREALNETYYNGKDRSRQQLFKQAGNSIVVGVVAAVMQSLYESMPYLFDDIQVGSFFSGIGAFEKALDRIPYEREKEPPDEDATLHKVADIPDTYGLNSRVYAPVVARTQCALGGGQGVKTGWYMLKK